MTTAIETRAQALTAKLTTTELVDAFEATIGNREAHTPELRGFLMNELERRNPAALIAWLDSTDDSPRLYFSGAACPHVSESFSGWCHKCGGEVEA